MRPLPPQLCWPLHPTMILPLPGSPLPPSCSRGCLAQVGAAERRQSHPSPDRMWQEKRWPPAIRVPSEITLGDGGLRGAPVTETLAGRQCHTGGEQEKQPFQESFPARGLAPVREGCEKAGQTEEELHLQSFTSLQRAAEPGWICGQQHNPRKVRGCPQLTRGL